MNKRTKLLAGVVAVVGVAVLGLATSGPRPEAKEGRFYVAGDGAKITTVIGNMAGLGSCTIPAGTIAFGERSTYFDWFQMGRIELTEVALSRSGCDSSNGRVYFKENPGETGWAPVESPEAIKRAEDILCAEPNSGDFLRLNNVCRARGVEAR